MTTFTHLTKLDLTPTQRNQYALIALWVLAMICLPIMKWTLGEDIIPTAVTFALLLQFIAVAYVMKSGIGWSKTRSIFTIVVIVTWGMEFLGSSTGFPFGDYDYTNSLQPQLAHVPLLIPLAWFMMLPSAWAVAQVIAGRNHLFAYATISAAAITAWDLFLDPQMVDWRFWLWADDGGYFGIPWVNYAGWFLTGLIVTVLVRPYRFALPLVPLLLIYGIVWFLQSIGQAMFWGQFGPALVGSISMGTLLLMAIHRYRNTADESSSV